MQQVWRAPQRVCLRRVHRQGFSPDCNGSGWLSVQGAADQGKIYQDLRSNGLNFNHLIRWCRRGPTSRGSHPPIDLLEVAADSGPEEAEAGGLEEATWGVLAAATEGDTEEDTPLTEEHYVTPINWALSMNYDTVLITIVVWNFQVFQLLTYESFFRWARVIAQELYKAGW